MSVVCIGGACIDRKYTYIEQARPGTSNAARAAACFGGVARNVAENLARLGVPVSLLSVVGDDETGAALLNHAESCGIDVSLVIRDKREATSEYVAILDERGELAIALADMHAVEGLTKAQIAQNWSLIERAEWLFVDCNVSADAIASCIEQSRNSRVRLAIDAVSEAKVRKLPERLDGVDVLFLNEGEASAYLDAQAEDVRDRGAAAVVLMRGLRGVTVASDVATEIAAPPARCIDATGAGDALIATTLYRLLEGDDLVEAVRTGVVGAALTVESNASVRPDLWTWIVP